MEEAKIISFKSLLILRLITCFDVAACTLFVWDYLLTFRMEVDLVWKSKWNFMKGLFLFQRYLPFIDTVWLVLNSKMGLNLTKSACRNIYQASAVLMTVGVAASEMILTIRTLAVWNRNQRLSIILPTLYAIVLGSNLVILSKLLQSMRFSDQHYPGFKGCFVTHTNKNLAFSGVLWLVWDTLMLSLMLILGVQMYRSGGRGRLSRTVYRDGLIYYLYIFILSLTNVITITILPFQFQEPIDVMARVIRPMLASRVLLDIRAQGAASSDSSVLLSELRHNPSTHLSEGQE